MLQRNQNMRNRFLSIVFLTVVVFAAALTVASCNKPQVVATGEVCDPPVAAAAPENAAKDAPETVETPVEAPAEEPAVNKESATESSTPDTQKKLPKLVDFGSTTCTPCKMMMPILGELSEENKGKLIVEFVNVYEQQGRAQKEGIRLIPLQVFYDKNGKELARHEGFYPMADILAKWKELGYTFKSKTAN
jgi:thioredoxin 1